MGNDGGDIPGRKELVKEKKKVEIPNSEAIARSRYQIFFYIELAFAI